MASPATGSEKAVKVSPFSPPGTAVRRSAATRSVLAASPPIDARKMPAWRLDAESCSACCEARTVRRIRVLPAMSGAPLHDEPKKATVPSAPTAGLSRHCSVAPPPPGTGCDVSTRVVTSPPAAAAKMPALPWRVPWKARCLPVMSRVGLETELKPLAVPVSTTAVVTSAPCAT